MKLVEALNADVKYVRQSARQHSCPQKGGGRASGVVALEDGLGGGWECDRWKDDLLES